MLFQNYFEEGKDVEDKGVLATAAKKCGVSEAIIQQFLETTDGAAEVQEEITYLKTEGISAVPSFILNEEHLVVGAQRIEHFQRYFSRLK